MGGPSFFMKEFDHSKYANWIDPAECVPYERNAKIHSDKQIDNIANSIQRFGWQQDTVLTADNVLVIGHGRRLAAMQLKCQMPSHRIDKTADQLTDEDIRELRIADNQTNAETGMDFDILEQEVEDLTFDGFDFDFDFGQIDMLEAEDDDFEEELPEEPKSKRGDIYQLGRHRLMCGDSTCYDDVEALCGDRQMDLLLTDPPYNVDYTGKTKDALKIENDSMEDENFRQFLRDAFLTADMFMKPGATFYIWHADSEGYNFRGACHDIGWTVRQCLIWAKNVMVMGRQDYQWKHEPCLYGWKEGAAHQWYSDRTQTTLLEFDRPTKSTLHPTMKPIPLFDYQIKNSSKKGDSVLDLFGGSGTTLICCEQDGRDCYMMELDPRYVDVIINRWEDFTGQKAVLLNGER